MEQTCALWDALNSCGDVWNESCPCNPRSKTALVLGYSIWCRSVWKDGEQEWNFPRDEVKADFTVPVRQPKYYAWFVFPEVPNTIVRGCEGMENLSKWGPKSIITEKASVHALSVERNCGKLRSCHLELTIFQSRAKEPSVSTPTRLRRLASHPAQIKCVHRTLMVSRKQCSLMSSASCLHGDLTDICGPPAGYIPPQCACSTTVC